MEDPATIPFAALAQAAATRRATTSTPRAWSSTKRRLLEAHLDELRAAYRSGLSRREIREQLAAQGIEVGRWLLDDIFRSDGITRDDPQ